MWQGFCRINSRHGWLGTHDALHPLPAHSSLGGCVVRVPLAPLPQSFLKSSWAYQTRIRSWGACLLVKKEGRRQGSDPLRSSFFPFYFSTPLINSIIRCFIEKFTWVCSLGFFPPRVFLVFQLGRFKFICLLTCFLAPLLSPRQAGPSLPEQGWNCHRCGGSTGSQALGGREAPASVSQASL